MPQYLPVAPPTRVLYIRTTCGHPDCTFCAKDFFAWWKAREANMQREDGRSGAGSFAQAASTSIRPPR